MAKLAVVGQDTSKMIDCSEAVPVPKPPVGKATTFPAGTNSGMVIQACPKPLPALATDGEYDSFVLPFLRANVFVS